jgi:glycosyltransferase involved in cell wall biosynthesis
MTRSLGLGGSERQLTEIAKALDRDRFVPHAGCFIAEGFRAEELRAAGVPVLEIPIRSFLSPTLAPRTVSLGRYLQQHEIQLVHTFDVPLNLYGVPAARLFRVPRVISSQRAHRALTPGLRRHLLRLTDRMVDAIVVNSEAVRRELIESDGVPASMIRLCYNGIDATQFRPVQRPEASALVVGVVCALRPEKGIDTLLRAFARLDRGLDVSLSIVGSGPSLPELEALARTLELGERCRFEPATKQVANRLHRIDIFVLPSLSEAFSNSLMEAMACQCCALASRVGGNPELLADGETGLLFRAGDFEDLARALDRVIRDPRLRLRLALAGRRKIETEFTLARAAATMGEIYASLLGMEAGLG